MKANGMGRHGRGQKGQLHHHYTARVQQALSCYHAGRWLLTGGSITKDLTNDINGGSHVYQGQDMHTRSNGKGGTMLEGTPGIVLTAANPTKERRKGISLYHSNVGGRKQGQGPYNDVKPSTDCSKLQFLPSALNDEEIGKRNGQVNQHTGDDTELGEESLHLTSFLVPVGIRSVLCILEYKSRRIHETEHAQGDLKVHLDAGDGLAVLSLGPPVCLCFQGDTEACQEGNPAKGLGNVQRSDLGQASHGVENVLVIDWFGPDQK